MILELSVLPGPAPDDFLGPTYATLVGSAAPTLYAIPMGMTRIVRNSNGAIVVGAVITVFLAGTTTPVTIYNAQNAAVPVASVTTDINGKYLIFVDIAEYPMTTAFKLVTSYYGIDVTEDYVR